MNIFVCFIIASFLMFVGCLFLDIFSLICNKLNIDETKAMFTLFTIFLITLALYAATN